MHTARNGHAENTHRSLFSKNGRTWNINYEKSNIKKATELRMSYLRTLQVPLTTLLYDTYLLTSLSFCVENGNVGCFAAPCSRVRVSPAMYGLSRGTDRQTCNSTPRPRAAWRCYHPYSTTSHAVSAFIAHLHVSLVAEWIRHTHTLTSTVSQPQRFSAAVPSSRDLFLSLGLSSAYSLHTLQAEIGCPRAMS